MNAQFPTFAQISFDPVGGWCHLASLNSAGQVAFWVAGTDEAILVGDGATLSLVADSSGPFSAFSNLEGAPPSTSIDQLGRVTFFADVDGGVGYPTAIYRGDGGGIALLYDPANTPYDAFNLLGANAVGKAVFLAFAPGSSSIIAGDGGLLTAVATLFPNVCGVIFTSEINEQGEVPFAYRPYSTACSAPWRLVVRTSSAAGEVLVADTSGEFATFESVAINNLGAVVFVATMDSGQRGLFRGGSADDAVVLVGDSLFGSTVTNIIFDREGLNDFGQISFQYFLADGRVGYAIATPVSPDCSNGLDDDADGKADSLDFGCTSASDTSERSASYICDDGLDNDGDALTDFPFDPGCAHARAKKENPACNDGLDNDNDGFIDFPADTYCTSAASSNESAPPPSSGGCGIGHELALAVPLLAWARRRRCASP